MNKKDTTLDSMLIRDPVHNYIKATWIEQLLIDNPNFQRLRFVHQNATAYLTYPSNTNTRFAHSLGVMHLAGIMFANSLKNAAPDVLGYFLQSCDKVFDRVERQALRIREPGNTPVTEWYKSLGNACRFFHDPPGAPRVHFQYEDGAYSINYFDNNDSSKKITPVTVERDPIYIINTLWQATRLAALVHDIGHFPMSHLFEVAISEFQIRCKDEATALEQEMYKRVIVKSGVCRSGSVPD